MSNCTKYLDMISSYIDNELTPAEEKELMTHIAECPSCRAVLDAYRAMFSDLERNAVEPPEELMTNVMSAVMERGTNYVSPAPEAKTTKKRRANAVLIRFAAIAACLAIVLFTVPKIITVGSNKSADAAASETVADTEMNGTGSSHDYSANKENAPAEVTEESAPETVEDAPEGDISGDPADGAGSLPEEGAEKNEPSNVCTITVFGELPDILADSAMKDNNDGSYTISVSRDTADALIAIGYDAYYSNPDMEEVTDYTVVFVP